MYAFIASFYQVKCFCYLVTRKSRHSRECALLIVLAELPLWGLDAHPIFFGSFPKQHAKVRTLISYDTGCDSVMLIVKAGWKIWGERETKMKCKQKNNHACGSRTKLCLILVSPQFLLFFFFFYQQLLTFSSCYPIMPLRRFSPGLVCSIFINWSRNFWHFFCFVLL